MSGEIRFVQGNEACVRGALYAGVRFFAGYPITPSTEIAEHLSEELPRVGGRFVQMEDEIASMCAVCGASLAGSKAMTATSGPGFSLKQEALGYAIMAEIPCVIVDVQRGGPSTGLPTECSQGDVMQARWGAHGDHAIIALTASSIQDVFSMTVEAFNLAETYRTAAALGIDTVLTSGGAASCRDAVPQLAELLRLRDELYGPEVLIGAGVNAAVIDELRAALPGARAFHASCKTLLESGMTFRREGVPMGLPGLGEWHIQQTDPDAVRAAKAAIMR